MDDLKELSQHLGEPVVRNRAPYSDAETLHDIGSSFKENAEGLYIEHAQEIPVSFVSMLRAMKQDSGSLREKEFMHVGCIPTVFVEMYLRQGFNVFNQPVKETCKRLVKDGLDAFVVTNKRI